MGNASFPIAVGRGREGSLSPDRSRGVVGESKRLERAYSVVKHLF
jgi:hypothetical protein